MEVKMDPYHQQAVAVSIAAVFFSLLSGFTVHYIMSERHRNAMRRVRFLQMRDDAIHESVLMEHIRTSVVPAAIVLMLRLASIKAAGKHAVPTQQAATVLRYLIPLWGPYNANREALKEVREKLKVMPDLGLELSWEEKKHKHGIVVTFYLKWRGLVTPFASSFFVPDD